MHDPGRWSVLIPAAGSGVRLGLGPKAQLKLGGRTLLERVVTAARAVSDDVIVALPSSGSPEAFPPPLGPNSTFIKGGPTRQETVRLLMASARRDWLLIHDVARPLCSPELMRAVAEAADPGGAAACLGPLDVPVAVVADGLIVGHHSPRAAGIFQSPLAFRRDVLEAAYARAAADGTLAQSTLELVLATGWPVRAVPGERANIKLTTPEDLALAEILASRFR